MKMTNAIPAVYENGVFRPLESPGVEENQRVYLLVLSEDLTALAASQRKDLEDIVALGNSGRRDVSTDHDHYLYTIKG